MYLDYYQLKQYPFAISPDMDVYCQFEAHQRAIGTVLFAIRSGEGIVKVTGPVGSGKTLICRLIMLELHKTSKIINITNPHISADELRKTIAVKLGVDHDPSDVSSINIKNIRHKLLEILKQHQHVVVFIDEAQLLPDESLEALRLLSNLETKNSKIIQIILVGQQELDKRLKQYQFRQLAQRISFSCKLSPLKLSEMHYYIDYRLAAAGYQGEKLFSKLAVRKIHSISSGIPRIANIIAHKASLLAYAKNQKTISYPIVNSVIKENKDFLGKTYRFYKRRYFKYLVRFSFGGAALSCAYYFYFTLFAKL